jgi:hypothetical protein
MVQEGARFEGLREQARHGVDGLKEDLTRQLTLMGNRSASYRTLTTHLVRLLDHSAQGASVTESLRRAWRRRAFRSFYERPLLLFAALRADALADGPSHPLHAALRDDAPEATAITDAALRVALDPARTGLWTSLSLRRVQTNETSRALAWLWPAALAKCSAGGRPLVLVDVGCSAGLNLIADKLPGAWTTGGATPLEVAEGPRVVGRIGLDERPLDVANSDDAKWLRACVWPGETQRRQRLDAAIEAFERMRGGPDHVEVVRRDCIAAASLARAAVATAPPDTLTIVYQTMMSGYLDAASRAAFEGSLEQLVVSSPARSVLWVDLEVTGPPTSPKPAELRVRARQGDRCVSFLIGAMGYHPTEVSVREDAVRELASLIG